MPALIRLLPSTAIVLAALALLLTAAGCSGAGTKSGGQQTRQAENSTGSAAAGDGSSENADGGGTADAERIHPAFDIDREALMATAEELPAELREAIRARPQYFLELVRRALELPSPYLRLVDKEHPLPEDYAPEDLVSLTDYRLTLNRSDLRLSRACMPDLLAMAEAARADGVELVLSSAFRSYEYQKGLYERYVEQHGKEEADRFSARPGTSQHQLGLTLDFGSITKEIIETDQGKWLAGNAWKYGFSLSYPEGREELTGYMYEPWHFRYISRTGTRLEQEFFGGIQQYLTEYLHAHHGFFTGRLSGEE
jgi:D-alanyl-D-alanine carboxypeptidase